MARFVEGYSQTVLHPAITRIALLDIHAMLAPQDQDYFRASREDRFGKPLEAVAPDRAAEIAAFPAKLEPLRHMLKFQPFLGGERPLFADYIVFGALQWLRITTGSVPEGDDPARQWLRALPRPLRRRGAGRRLTHAWIPGGCPVSGRLQSWSRAPM